MFSQDFKELLSAFNEHRVKYLIVGGYAVAVHSQPRATKDLDIFVEPSSENAKAVFAALAKFGAPLADLRPEDLTDPNIFFRMGTPPQMVDILSRISGVEFDEAWKRRIEAVIDERIGLKAFVISANDLIANKTAFGRPYDLADVDAIRKAAESQRPKPEKG
ncbi:MAG TPA: DUF6036 family nucleotidyltransferase [Bryobacteraceae bacterium]|nr:DUF6036 family nucleotidyltransferase [Bryobacteraceae bacterium]